MTFLETGLLVCAIVSVLALVVALHSLQRVRRQAGENEKLIQKLMREVAASSSGSVGMGQRLLAMEKRLQANATKQSEKIVADGQGVNIPPPDVKVEPGVTPGSGGSG
jgi:Flp pilus assembly protein TadB